MTPEKLEVTLSDGSILKIIVGGDRDIAIETTFPIAVIPLATNRCKIALLSWNEQRVYDIQA